MNELEKMFGKAKNENTSQYTEHYRIVETYSAG